MRVLEINNFHFKRGGADIVYFNTIDLLKKNGHTVFNFSLNHQNNLENAFSDFFPESLDYRSLKVVKKIRAIKSFIDNKQVYLKLKNFVKFYKPEIAHIHLFLGGLTTSALLALKECNIPIVLTVHDYRLICPAYTLLDKNNNICELCKDKFYLRCAYKKCSNESNFANSTVLSLDSYYRKYVIDPMKYIDKYVFVSDFSRKKHIEFNNQYENKSLYIYNYSPQYNSISSKRGKYFIYFGRLSREKGIVTLIKAANQLNIKLKIVGDGPLIDELKSIAKDNVEILGLKQGDELINLVKYSSFVIVPSECYENNPLTIVEAFSLGKPVIGSAIGGITELLKDSRGILYNPKEITALSSALQQAQYLDDLDYFRMSQSINEFYDQNFSENIHYNKLISVFNELVS